MLTEHVNNKVEYIITNTILTSTSPMTASKPHEIITNWGENCK